MTFYDVLSYFKTMPGKDLFALLGELESGILFLASKWHCPAALFYVIGIALALTFGFLAYRWIRASVIAANAIFGILVGAAAFYALWGVLPRLPAVLCYLFCFIAATIFVCLPIKKPIVALAFYAAIVAYFIMDFYVPSTVVCLGAAFVAVVLTVLIPRVVCVLSSGAVCGILTASFLSMMIPTIPALDEHPGAWLIAGGLTVVFLHVQFFTTDEKKYV